MDIVDQHDVPPAQAFAAIGRDGEHAGNGARTSFRAHPAQRRGRLGAAQHQGIVRHGADPAERGGNERGLVEPARP